LKSCVTNEELGVGEAEGIFVVVDVLPRPEEEEEGDDDHVCGGTVGVVTNV
jgi:hypothetical protein